MNNKDQSHFEKMANKPVGPLIISLGIPTTISMLITNIYNMADTYFVSQISLAASGATGIVFSIMAILQAFGFMFGHGAGSNISRALGRKDNEKANRFTSTALFLSCVTGILLCILGLIFNRSLMKLLGSTPTILPSAMAYAKYIFISAPAMVMGCVLNNILRYEGRATFAMFGLTTGGILNMVMDPILIFKFGMGIDGAGLSTAISQYISLIILFLPYIKGVTTSKLSVSYISHDFKDIKNILYSGSPNLCRQGLNSIASATLNLMAKPFGDVAIAAMSIVSRCTNLIFSTALGIAQGFQPVSAFNYGSKNYKRVKDATLFTILFGTCLISVIGAIVYLNAETIVASFRKDLGVIEIGSAALRYMCMAIVFLPFASVSSMLFQSVGEREKALFLAVCQGGLYAIPLFLVLPGLFGVKGIEIATPLSYILFALTAAPLTIGFLKQLDELNQH